MSDAERPGDQPNPYGPQGPGGFQPPQGPGGPNAGAPGYQGPPTGPPPNPYAPYDQQGPPNQPSGQQGPPNQPYGQQPQPGSYGPGQPFGPQPGGPQQFAQQPGQPNPYGPPQVGGPGGPPAKKSKLPLIIGAVAVALLLIVGIAVAVFAGRDTPVATDPTDPTDPASAPASDKPSDAVRGYLEALAANDATRALSYLDDQPADKTFLTNEMLVASSKKAAITAIDVPEVTDKYAYKVAARYQFGDQSVSEDFSVSEAGGGYKLSRAVTELDLSYQRDDTLPMLINGVELTTDKAVLFPGTYAFTTSSKWVSYGDKAQLTLTGPSDYDSPRLTPTLKSDGKAAFIKATKAALTKCLDQRKLAPSGCPNRVSLRKGQKITESTVRWSLTNDPFKNARVSLDYNDPTAAEATFYPQYRFKAKGSTDGRSGTFDGTPTGIYSFKSSGDLSGDTIKVKLVIRG